MAKKKKEKKYEIGKSVSVNVTRTVAYIVLTFLSILCLIWFYFLFINATRSNTEIIRGFKPYPSTNFGLNWSNLKDFYMDFTQGLKNSAFIAFLAAIVTVYFATLTAYALYAYKFKGSKFMNSFILAIMMIPAQVTSLGFYNLVTKQLGLENSYIPLILPAMAAPITYFYLIQYMRSNLSLSLVEAARIDGSGEFKTFNRIVIPLMKPALAVQAIFAFVQSWNNYYIPALIIKDNDKKTLPILIYALRSAAENEKDVGLQYCAMTVSILPVIVVYLIFSRFIVGGVALGGVKE